MKKKGTGICIAALITLFPAIGANAQTPVDLKVNENIITTKPSSFIENGSTYAPIRTLGLSLGASSISWDNNTKTATIISPDTEIKISSGSKIATVNGVKKTMPTSAVLKDSRIFANARFLAESLGGEVSWNKKTHTVEITKDDHVVSSQYIEDDYTPSDLEWLAKIVHAEAGGEIHDGKVGVANVVLNRIDNENFPNNVYDVVFDKKFGVQFTPVANGAIHNNPSTESYHAAKQALFGKNTVGKSLYFCNPKISTNFWIINNRLFFKRLGNHDFYL